MSQLSSQIALHTIQQALTVLGQWTQTPLNEPITLDNYAAVETAERWLGKVSANTAPEALQLIFDQIDLKIEPNKDQANHYWPAVAIADTEPKIHYPVHSAADAKLEAFRTDANLKKDLESLQNSDDWENLALLSLVLEKYGSYISYGDPDISLYDRAKMTAAVASALAQDPNAEKLCLVAGDLSGIQDFIYTISSAGALKSLRARSFVLELVAEEIVQQLLEKLKLPRTSVIYSGGGNLYILAPATENTQTVVANVRSQLNHWLLDNYQGKVFLALTGHNFSASYVGSNQFADEWEQAIKELTRQKNRKFENGGQLDRLLSAHEAHEPCKVCHRDDVENLKPLSDDNGPDACPTCCKMFTLGQVLFKVKAFVRSQQPEIGNKLGDPIEITLGGQTIYYHLFEGAKNIPKEPHTVYLINNWEVDLYRFSHFNKPTLLLLGNYGKEVERQESEKEKGGFITAEEMAAAANGIKRVGHLRMDVDRLGRIFAKGLGENYNLPRLSGLSRQMSYFFKPYLCGLAANRSNNVLANNHKRLTDNARDHLLFIYAGGDDLFVSGPWNEIVEFGFDVYQSFRSYTGYHPEITLSAGVSLCGPKYPLYQSANDSGDAESKAKNNGRDSLTLFGQTFKWQEWLGCEKTSPTNIPIISKDTRDYLKAYEGQQLELYGILPFVQILNRAINLPRSFVQNLLNTAQLQEQTIKDKKQIDKRDKQKTSDDDLKDLRYFLHLPKVAYTLARLPNSTRAAPDMNRVTSSLKSPYNAPYFRAIATWLDLLNRSANQNNSNNG